MRTAVKRFFAAMIACSVVIGMCVVPSYAEEATTSVSCTVEDGVYSISGTGRDSQINVVIMPADGNAEGLTAEKISQPDHIAFSMKNSSGTFEKSFALPQDFSEGEYKSVLWDGADDLEVYFINGTEDYKNELLGTKIKNGLLDEAVERYGAQYGIDVAAYESLKESVKNAVQEALAAVPITDFRAQYNESVIKASFEQLENAQEVYGVLVMLNTDFTTYNKLNEDEQESVLLKLLKNLPDTPEQLKTLAEEYSSAAYQEANKTPSGGASGGSSSSRGPSAGSPIISAGINKPETSLPSLSDIVGHWAEDSIAELVEKGIVSGSGDGKFYPENNITRAEFSKMLVDTMEIDTNTGAQQQFTDVDNSAWYYGYVMALYKQGIMSGYEDGTFCPDNSITRQEMAAVIYRVLQSRGIPMDDEAEFTDISEVSEYARTAVVKLGGAKILSGFDGYFRPADSLTRAEAAVVMLKTYNILEGIIGMSVASYASARSGSENLEPSQEASAKQQTLLVEKSMTRQEARVAEAEQIIPKLLNRAMRGVTRAGFVSDVYDLTTKEQTTASTQYFTDLPVSREETPSIQAAADRGFIEDEGEFRPDEVITGYEAIRVMVCALGYKDFAEAAGGWPSGYIKAADKAGLMYNVSNVAGGALDAKTAKLLLLNMLQSRVVTIGTVSAGKIEFVTDEMTLLEKAHGIYMSTGTVQETVFNSLKRTGIKEQPYLTIEGKKYFIGEDDEGDYLSDLGYNVNVYYTEENELFAIARTEKNKTVTFPIDGTTIENRLTVLYTGEDDKKAHQYKLNEDYSFLYNEALSTRTPEQVFLETDDGTVEMLDNDNDGKYDVIRIKKPEFVQVNSISKTNKLIYDKNASENTLDLYDEEVILHVEGRNGQQMRFLDISSGETYEVYTTEDHKLVNLKLMSSTLVGSATAISNGEVIVNGIAYKTTDYFDKYYLDILKLGNNYSFITSSDGKLIAYAESGSSMKIGYIISAGWLDGAEEESMFIRMFTQDNAFMLYTVDNTLRVDGRKTEISNLYNMLLSGNAVNNQLVKYQADDGGKIKMLDFSERNTGNTLAEKKSEENALTEYVFQESSFYYKDTVELMYPSFNISGTIVFVIPNDLTDRDNFKVTNSAFFTDGQNYSNLKIYNLSENGTAEVVVVRADASIPPMTKYISSFVVEKVQEEVNEDDEVMRRIYGWVDQKYRSYFIDENVSIYKASGETLGFGDVVRFYADGDMIRSLVCDFDANENVFARNNDTSAADINGGNKDFMYQFGRAYSIGNGFIYIGGGENGTDMSVSAIRNFKIDTVNIALINLKAKTVKTGTLSDIRTYKNSGAGDIVLIRQRNLFTMAIYVYVQ